MDTSALTDRIKAVRVLISDMERETAGTKWSHPRRAEIAKQYLFLDGLQEAAKLLGIDVTE
jgi:hypothetical protein